MGTIDTPSVNDNRAYDYTGHDAEIREEYAVIVSHIPEGSRVLDLGCGNGALLRILREQKNVTGVGIDISPTGVEAAVAAGVDARVGRIDGTLDLPDGSFDVAVCNVTIQMVEYPERLLREMKRVAATLIVSFPNFGFYRNRLDLLFGGRMPRPTLFGYSWYSTGHIHQLGYADFLQLVNDVGGLSVVRRLSPQPNGLVRRVLSSLLPDLFQMVQIVVLTRSPGR